jgi:tetratricopeptide (TPR) repeat protein
MDQPIRAKRPTWADRFGKWTRRHKSLVSSSVVVLLVVVLGLAASTFLLLRKQQELVTERDRAAHQQQRAEQAEQMAKSQQAKAEQAAAITKEINRFLTEELLGQADPARNAVGDQVTLLEVLDRASQNVDTAFREEPETKAALHQTVGQAYSSLGQYEKSAAHYRAALDTLRGQDASPRPETLKLMIQLGKVLTELGQLDAAEAILRESLDTSRRVWGIEHALALDAIVKLSAVAQLREKDDMTQEITGLLNQHVGATQRMFGKDHPAVLKALDQLACTLHETGEPAEAEPLLRQVAEARRRVLGPDQRDTLDTMNHLGLALMEQGKWAEAEQVMRENLEAKRRALGSCERATLEEANNLAAVLTFQRKYDDANNLFREAVNGMRQSHGANHPDTLEAVNNLSWLLMVRNRLDEAEQLLRNNWEEICRTRGPQHIQAITTGTRLGSYLLDQGDYRAAETIGRSCLEAARRSLGEEHTATQSAVAVLAFALYAQGRPAEADAVTAGNLGAILFGKGDESVLSSLVGWKALDDGDMNIAIEWTRNAVAEKRRNAHSVPPISLATSLAFYGRVLVMNNWAWLAEPDLRECLAIRQASLGDSHWLTAEAESLLALCLIALDRYADAELLLVHAYPAIERSPELSPWQKAEAMERFVVLYEQWGKRAEMENWVHQMEAKLQELLSDLRASHPEDAVSIAELEGRLGDCAATCGRYAEAEQLLLKSFDELSTLVVDSKANSQPRLNRIRGESLDRLVRYHKLRSEAEQADAWRLLDELGSSSLTLRSAEACVSAWEAMAVERPDAAVVHLNLANSCLALAKLLPRQANSEEELRDYTAQAVAAFAKAEAALSAVLKADPERRRATELLLACYLRRAESLKVLEQYQQAFADYERAIAIQPDNLGALRNAAWSMANCPDPAQRQVEKALALASRAVESDPGIMASWQILGRVQYRAGQWSEAIQSVSKLVTPDDVGGSIGDRLILAMAYWQLGDRESARAWYERAAKRIAKNTKLPPVHLRAILHERDRLQAETCELLGIPLPESPTDSDKSPASSQGDKGDWWARAGGWLRQLRDFTKPPPSSSPGR